MVRCGGALITRAMASLLAVAAIAAMPTGAAAQDGFFFSPPSLSLELRSGRTGGAPAGAIYKDLTTNLTLSRGDFAATAFSADLLFRASDGWDVLVGAGYARIDANSEFREYVDQDDQPIEQKTSLLRVPFTAGARLYPLSRGESIGLHAWIPRSFTPYVGAGAGLMHYNLEQRGDFVDYEDFSIFTDDLESAGNAPMAYGEAGASWWVTHRVGITGGARYTFAKADMRRDFEAYDDIDLGGFQATAGLAVRF